MVRRYWEKKSLRHILLYSYIFQGLALLMDKRICLTIVENLRIDPVERYHVLLSLVELVPFHFRKTK